MTLSGMLKNASIYIAKALLNFSIFGTILLILRYVNKDLFAALIYYSDPHVLLTDSSGYMFFYILVSIPILIILMMGILYFMIDCKLKALLSMILVTIGYFFIMKEFVSSKALNEEVVELNYFQYYNEAQSSSKSRKLYIAKMLEQDCEIKVVELNRDIFFKDDRPVIVDDMYNANQCKGLDIEGKKKLVEYLQNERLISFSK